MRGSRPNAAAGFLLGLLLAGAIGVLIVPSCRCAACRWSALRRHWCN